MSRVLSQLVGLGAQLVSAQPSVWVGISLAPWQVPVSILSILMFTRSFVLSRANGIHLQNDVRTALDLCGLPSRNTQAQSGHDMNVGQVLIKGHSTKYPTSTLRTVKVIKNRASLRNCCSRGSPRRPADDGGPPAWETQGRLNQTWLQSEMVAQSWLMDSGRRATDRRRH